MAERPTPWPEDCRNRSAADQYLGLMAVPDEQKRQAKGKVRHPFDQRQRQGFGRWDAIDAADRDEARFLNAKRARHQKTGGAHRLADTLDRERLAIADRKSH